MISSNIFIKIKFRAFHDKEKRPKRGISKSQWLTMVTVASFAYGIIPGHFFPSISALSFVCWIWNTSVTAQLIGSARNGFGLGTFGLDWNIMTGFVGNPLIYPLSTIINIAVGFVFFLYVICPIAYWTNLYDAKKFPHLSFDLFDKYGQMYNVSKILNEDDLTFNEEGYESYSIPYKRIAYVFTDGFQFASLMATLSHFVMFHGRYIQYILTLLHSI